MTRPYYDNGPEGEYWRRSNRPMPLAVSHGPRDEARPYSLLRRGSRGSPIPESEPDKSGSQPRRRIAVAVSVLHPRCSNIQLSRLVYSVWKMPKEKDKVQWRSRGWYRMQQLQNLKFWGVRAMPIFKGTMRTSLLLLDHQLTQNTTRSTQ